VPRQEYLANSFSRNIPWEAKGISRRTWERRRKKAMVDAAASLSGFASQVHEEQSMSQVRGISAPAENRHFPSDSVRVRRRR